MYKKIAMMAVLLLKSASLIGSTPKHFIDEHANNLPEVIKGIIDYTGLHHADQSKRKAKGKGFKLCYELDEKMHNGQYSSIYKDKYKNQELHNNRRVFISISKRNTGCWTCCFSKQKNVEIVDCKIVDIPANKPMTKEVKKGRFVTDQAIAHAIFNLAEKKYRSHQKFLDSIAEFIADGLKDEK